MCRKFQNEYYTSLFETRRRAHNIFNKNALHGNPNLPSMSMRWKFLPFIIINVTPFLEYRDMLMTFYP